VRFFLVFARTSLKRPVLVTFVGSYSSSLSVPRVCVYAAYKVYTHRLSSCLHADERYDSPNSNLSFMVVNTASVNSNIMHQPGSRFCPSADDYTCGEVTWLWEAVSHPTPWTCSSCWYLPRIIHTSLIGTSMKKVVEAYAK
jgi:short-subunit dehydrogenase